jgi:hypothetical protein
MSICQTVGPYFEAEANDASHAPNTQVENIIKTMNVHFDALEYCLQ